jgi:hypothetical protein
LRIGFTRHRKRFSGEGGSLPVSGGIVNARGHANPDFTTKDTKVHEGVWVEERLNPSREYNANPMAATPAGHLRQLLKRVVAYSALSVAAICTLAYGADWGIFHFRLAMKRQPFDSITVDRYYAVPQKNGKTEFIFQPPEAQVCSKTLFPQDGYVPCWYLRRHTDQRTDI